MGLYDYVFLKEKYEKKEDKILEDLDNYTDTMSEFEDK